MGFARRRRRDFRDLSTFCLLLPFLLLKTTYGAVAISHVTIQSKLGAHSTLIAALLIEKSNPIVFFSMSNFSIVIFVIWRCRTKEQSATDVLSFSSKKETLKMTSVLDPQSLSPSFSNAKHQHHTRDKRIPPTFNPWNLHPRLLSIPDWTYPLFTSCSAIILLQLIALVKHHHHPTFAIFNHTTSNHVLDAKTVYSSCQEQR